MNPRLVAHLNLDANVCEPALHSADHGVFGLP